MLRPAGNDDRGRELDRRMEVDRESVLGRGRLHPDHGARLRVAVRRESEQKGDQSL